MFGIGAIKLLKFEIRLAPSYKMTSTIYLISLVIQLQTGHNTIGS